VIEALPDELKIVLGGVVCLALPFVVGWMAWGLVRSGRGVARGLAGGPAKACQALGLQLTRSDALSGEAAGQFEGWPVRVGWRVGPQHGFDEHQQHTWVHASVQPPLGAGFEARQDLPAPTPPWPELEGLGARAADPTAARAALARAAPALAHALAGPGGVTLDDTSVSIELPGIETDEAKLGATLRSAVAVATALSRR